MRRTLGWTLALALALAGGMGRALAAPERHWQKGRAALREGRTGEALEHFRAGKAAGEGVEAALGLLEAALEFGDVAEAERALLGIDRELVEDGRWQELGRRFTEQLLRPRVGRGDWVGLGAQLEVARAYGWRGRVLSELRLEAAQHLGDLHGAVEAFDELLALEEQDEALRGPNGRAAARLGRTLAEGGAHEALRVLEVADARSALAPEDAALVARLRREKHASAAAMMARLRAAPDPELAKEALRRYGADPELKALALEVLGVGVGGGSSPETAAAPRLPAGELDAMVVAAEAALAEWRLEDAARALGRAEQAGVDAARLAAARNLLGEREAAQELLAAGRHDLEVGHAAEAAEKLGRARAAGQPEAERELARAWLRAGRVAEALPLLRRLHAERPGSRALALELAEAEEQGGGAAGALRAAGLLWSQEGPGRALAVLLPPMAPYLALGLFLVLLPVAAVFLMLGRRLGLAGADAARRALRTERQTLDSEKARVEDERDRAVRRALGLSHVAQQVKRISSAFRRDEVVAALVEAVTQCLSTNSMQIWSVDPVGRRLVPVHHSACKAPGEEPLDPRSPFGWMMVQRRPLDRRELERTPSLTALRSSGSVALGVGLPVVPVDVPGLVLNLPDVDPDRLEASDLIVLQALGSVTALALQNAAVFQSREDELDRYAEEAEKSRALLKKVVSPDVAERMMELSRSGGNTFDSKKMVLSILFTDIRGFTSLSENLPPEEVVRSLNEYLGEMTRIVFENQGTLDKYWGDALVAYFGAPVEFPDHARWAVRAAEAMQRRLWDLTVRWAARGLPTFEMGIGISTGPVVWGAIGSEAQMSYTVIGDTVNLAARLQAAALSGQILLSRGAADSLGGQGPLRALPPLRVKGKAQPVEVFEWQVEDGP